MKIEPRFIGKDPQGKVSIVPSNYPNPQDNSSLVGRPIIASSSSAFGVPNDGDPTLLPGQGYGRLVTLTDGANIATNCNLSNLFQVTLAGNRTLSAPSNLRPTSYCWLIKQDTTGNRTLTFNSVFKFPGGADKVLSTAGNSVDMLVGVSDGTNIFCFLHKTFA